MIIVERLLMIETDKYREKALDFITWKVNTPASPKNDYQTPCLVFWNNLFIP